MPVEIKELIIKATVENNVKVSPSESSVNLLSTDFELAMKQILRKMKNQNER